MEAGIRQVRLVQIGTGTCSEQRRFELEPVQNEQIGTPESGTSGTRHNGARN